MTKYADRVAEQTGATGTGALTLAGAATGGRTFADGFTSGDEITYTVENADRTEWETGTGTYTTGSISRDTISASSNGGALVNFSGGVKTVFATVGADLLTPVKSLVSGVWRNRSITYLPSAMAFGNSIVKQNQVAANGAANQISYNAHLWWARAFSGNPFEWIQTGSATQIGGNASSVLCQGIYGFSGGTSNDITPFFTTVVTPNKPKYLFIQVMENDITAIVSASMTRDQAKANYLSIIQQCVELGTVPIWIGCLPAKTYTLAGHSAEFWGLSSYVESLQSIYATLVYVPMHDVYTNSTLTTPQPVSAGIYANYVDASVHPYAVAPKLGSRIAEVMAIYGVVGFGLIPGPGDARYMGGNAFTAGTAGTASAPVTGSVVNNLTVSSSTTTQTIAASVVDRNNRQALKIDMTAGTATGIQAAWSVYGAAGGYTTGFSVGDLVQFVVEVEFDEAVSLVGIRDLSAYLQFVGSTGDPYIFKKANGDTFDTVTIPVGKKMVLTTPLTSVPSGTTGLRPFFVCFASNNAASVVNRAYVTKYAVVNWSKTN